MRIDLHTHSSVSDGTDTPTRLVLNAQRAGLDVVALADHDTFDGLAEAQHAGARIGVQVVNAVEMSTKLAGRSVHLLGYGARVDDPELNAELAQIRQSRQGRLAAMAQKLTDLGYPLTEADILAQAMGAPSVGRPHVADAMIAKGYIADRKEAFIRFLDHDGPAYVSRYAADLPRAIELIRRAGGVAVLAHPWGRDNEDVLTVDVIHKLTFDHGLDGIEVDHQDHTMDKRHLLYAMGGRLGLIRTGGSDYHGTGKVNHDLGCNTTRATALREIVNRIRNRGGQPGGLARV